MKDEFINVSYFSAVKIARDNIYKGLKRNAGYASGKLVDIGCGIKPYEPIFKPYVELYFGVDYPQTIGSHYGINTKADLYADCSETGIRDSVFDTLLSTQVIEHVFDTRKFIKECNRILVPGGIGIFTVPFLWECHSEPYDFYRFTKYSIQKLFNESGFKIIVLENLEGAYAALMQARIIYMFGRRQLNVLQKVLCKLKQVFLLPYLNYKALHFDRMYYNYNDKLCLNYLLVVKKINK